jgi:DNA-binding MarR family transcriptional regulator
LDTSPHRLRISASDRPAPRASHRLPGLKVPRPIEHWTGFALIAAADSAQRRYSHVLQAYGLTVQDFMVLSVVAGREGMTGGWISERLGVSRQLVSKILCRLDRIGFIARAIRLNDFRSKDIWLSDDGKAHYASMCEAIDRIDRGLHEKMAPHQRVALRRLLLHLVPGEQTFIRWSHERAGPERR